MQLLLVVATVAICGVAQAQQGVDPAYLRQYYQQLQQQQQHQQPSDGTPIYEQNSEQTQQYVSAGQQIRLKDTVSEQIRAQQQQGYVAPAVRDYLQQPQVGGSHSTLNLLPGNSSVPLFPSLSRPIVPGAAAAKHLPPVAGRSSAASTASRAARLPVRPRSADQQRTTQAAATIVRTGGGGAIR